MRYITACIMIFFTLSSTLYAQDCIDPILAVGDVGKVLGDTSNNVREEPSTSGAVVGGIEAGGTFTVTELGTCDGGIRWIQVEATNGFTGWTAESLGTEAFVAPVVNLDTDFAAFEAGNLAINSDGTLIAIGDKLYDAVTLDLINDDLSGIGDVLFSPTDPNILFRFFQDYDFTLVDLDDMTVIWSAEYTAPSGIGGGIFAGEAYFTTDGRYIIFSSTEAETSWQTFNLDTEQLTFVARSYFGEVVALQPNSTNMVRFIASIQGYETPPFSVDDIVAGTATGISGQAMRPVGFRNMLYMPDGSLLTADIDGAIELFTPELTFDRAIDLQVGEVLDWTINDDTVAIVQSIDDSSYELTLLSANSRNIRGRVSLQLDEGVRDRVHVAWHPDGALGLKVDMGFRWVDVDPIIDGTMTEIFVPAFGNQ